MLFLHLHCGRSRELVAFKVGNKHSVLLCEPKYITVMLKAKYIKANDAFLWN